MVVAAVLALSLLAAPTKVAVTPIALTGVDAHLGQLMEESLAQALRKRGLEVVTRQDLTSLLGFERQKELLGCSESTSCLAELNSALGCEQLVVTSLGKVEGGYRGVSRLLSTRDGRVLRQASFAAANNGALIDAFEEVADELTGQGGKSASSLVRWVPAMVGVAALGGAAVFFAQAGQRYEQVRAAPNVAAATAPANEGKAFQAAAWGAVGVGVAGVAWSVAWVAMGRQAPQVSVAYSPELGVSVQGAFP